MRINKLMQKTHSTQDLQDISIEEQVTIIAVISLKIAGQEKNPTVAPFPLRSGGYLRRKGKERQKLKKRWEGAE